MALTALDLPDDARRRLLVRAWFAFTEDLVGQWIREPTMSRDELLALLRDVLDRLAGALGCRRDADPPHLVAAVVPAAVT